MGNIPGEDDNPSNGSNKCCTEADLVVGVVSDPDYLLTARLGQACPWPAQRHRDAEVRTLEFFDTGRIADGTKSYRLR